MDLGPVMALVSGPTVADAIGDPQNELAKLVAREQDDAKVVDEIFLRILNRPATPAEIKAALANRDRIRADHEKLVAAMKKREADLPAITARRERERQEAIAAAQKEIADYEPESKKLQEQRAAEREKSIMEASDRIRAHETNLARSQEEWEKRQPTRSLWTVLQPATLQASSGAVLTLRPDGSIVATGPNAKTTYTLTAKTNLRGITGLRLETLPDPSLPNQGPGRAGDGNFVLTEIELYAAPASDPAKLAKIDLQKPRADFSQQGLDVRFAVDGKTNEPNQGWAISPSYKVPHWAVFETATAVGGEGETVLRVTIHHQFNQPQYTLGRFRLSVTTQGRDFPLGLSEELQQVVSTPAAERTDAQRQALAAYYRALDGTWIALNQALATVSQPLGPDPKMEELKATLAEVSRPLGEDSLLAQLRADVKASEQQLKEERLTAAQDLAWALINSPAFLFNH
jgi:hypothetical protein